MTENETITLLTAALLNAGVRQARITPDDFQKAAACKVRFDHITEPATDRRWVDISIKEPAT